MLEWKTYIPFCIFDLARRALPRTQCNNFIAQLNPIGIASENLNAFRMVLNSNNSLDGSSKSKHKLLRIVQCTISNQSKSRIFLHKRDAELIFGVRFAIQIKCYILDL